MSVRWQYEGTYEKEANEATTMRIFLETQTKGAVRQSFQKQHWQYDNTEGFNAPIFAHLL